MPIESAVVSINFQDGTNERLTVGPTTVDRKPLFDLLMAVSKEGSDGYRFFGNLRALITWFPALIMFTVIAQIGVQFVSGWPQYLPGIVLGIVFLLIYLAQRFLESAQRKCRAIARAAAYDYKKLYEGEVIETRTYEEFREQTVTPRGGVFGDRPSQILLIFFIVVLAFSVVMSSCTLSVWLGPTPVCSPETADRGPTPPVEPPE